METWTEETRVEITPAGRALLQTLRPPLAVRSSFDYPDDYCPTCDGRGEVPAGGGGNMELTTNCPDCTPDYR